MWREIVLSLIHGSLKLVKDFSKIYLAVSQAGIKISLSETIKNLLEVLRLFFFSLSVSLKLQTTLQMSEKNEDQGGSVREMRCFICP